MKPKICPHCGHDADYLKCTACNGNGGRSTVENIEFGGCSYSWHQCAICRGLGYIKPLFPKSEICPNGELPC